MLPFLGDAAGFNKFQVILMMIVLDIVQCSGPFLTPATPYHSVVIAAAHFSLLFGLLRRKKDDVYIKKE